MNAQPRAPRQMSRFLPIDIDGFDLLAELALDLHWSWNHATDSIWRRLDTELWELTHNPWVVLQTVSRHRLKTLLADPTFRGHVQQMQREKQRAAQKPTWFQQTYADAPLTCIAYFSMEFMLSEALPIYSGGLGNVAGDQLKAASDLGVPVVGVGLLYQQGYFRQVIGQGGVQEALYPYNDPGQLPITPLRDEQGEWLRLEIRLPGYSIWLRAWQVQVGRAQLYLLDSNDAANLPAYRGITSELYGGGTELRLRQELVLGIGGWRLLKALGIQPQVCHLNEGHAAFAVIERARDFMHDTGQSFDVALAATRPGNHFTTHTAVPAGFDLFPPELIVQYLGYYAHRLDLSPDAFLALGRLNPHDAAEPFNMAYLAVRGSGAVNGVSRLHGQVSRGIFAPLFDRWPESDVPVAHVTNGIHTPSWDSAESDALWTDACGKERWTGFGDDMEQEIRRIPDDRLWQMRTANRKALVDFARARLSRDLAIAGQTRASRDRARGLFDPNALTIGFARRFATYKRPTLLLHDPQRLLRLLTSAQRPVQLIIAGKAHPADKAGQEMIAQWIRFIDRPEVRPHVIFLSDYDMLLTENLVQGVDVWLNTPRRPWEACGTSGMKVLVNGGLNLSELDGWWAEAYAPQVGWALGDGQADETEAEILYRLLEQEVVPEFYTRNAQGVPTAWVARMRESMARLTPRYSAIRAVRQYTEQYYLPAAINYRERSARKGAIGAELVAWRHELDSKWPNIHFGEVRTESAGDHTVFDVQLFLNGLDADLVRVELYADGLDGEAPVRQELTQVRPLTGSVNGYAYRASVPAGRPPSDFTPRVVPAFANAAVPLEASHILWQR